MLYLAYNSKLKVLWTRKLDVSISKKKWSQILDHLGRPFQKKKKEKHLVKRFIQADLLLLKVSVLLN